jgi:hypothetical protein
MQTAAFNRRACDSENSFRIIPGFAARGEMRELAGVARKHHLVEFRGPVDDSDAFQRLARGIRLFQNPG